MLRAECQNVRSDRGRPPHCYHASFRQYMHVLSIQNFHLWSHYSAVCRRRTCQCNDRQNTRDRSIGVLSPHCKKLLACFLAYSSLLQLIILIVASHLPLSSLLCFFCILPCDIFWSPSLADCIAQHARFSEIYIYCVEIILLMYWTDGQEGGVVSTIEYARRHWTGQEKALKRSKILLNSGLRFIRLKFLLY